MQLKNMEQRVAKIKSQLQNIGEMRPGSINKQFTVCGKAGCVCIAPEKPQKHGPYYQLSYGHNGKSTTQFIKKELLHTVMQQLKNYKKFKLLTTEWVDLALSIAKEKLDIERQQMAKDRKK